MGKGVAQQLRKSGYSLPDGLSLACYFFQNFPTRLVASFIALTATLDALEATFPATPEDIFAYFVADFVICL